MSDLKDIVINEIKVDTVLTKSNLPIAGYSINPYVGCPFKCRYCYACFMNRFTGHKEMWGGYLDVKYWAPIKKNERYSGKTMIIGSVTDPYNYFEKKYERTRSFLEEMRGSGINLIITTKSDLVLRDLDLIKTYKEPLVAFSINTLDESFRESMDRAVSIERRIEALKVLHENKIRTCCFISPIFPGITNVIEIIEKIKDYCDYIWVENLNLRGGFKGDILDYIRNERPELVDLYTKIYTKKDLAYWSDLDREVSDYCRENNLLYVINEEPFLMTNNKGPIIINYFYHEKIKQSARK